MSDNFVINGTVNMGMNVNDILGGVKQVQSAFNGLKMPSNITANMTKDFDKLKEVLAKMRDLSNKQTFSKSDIKGLDKLQAQAQSLFSSIENSYNELNGKQIYLQADWSKIKEAQSELDKLKSDIQNKLSDIKLNLTTTSGGTKAFGMEELISGMEKGVKSSKVLSAAMQEVRNSLQTGDFSGITKIFSEIEAKAGTLKGAGAGLLDMFKQMGLITFEGPAANLAKTEQGVKLLHTAFAELTKQFPQSSAEIQKLAQEFDLVTQKKAQLEATGKANWAAEAEKSASAMKDYGNAADQAAQSTKKVIQSTVDAANQVKQLQQSTQYFFSLRNMINLLKRGIHEAIDTVKELDAAMTETAVVVPEWDVGDMWAKLPEYTKNANALGASVVDLYKATTLYYQQGLRGNDVMDIAAETMKMARIGGLEAADATDKMTAAIRGFNMEVSQESAQRVNDVYSNLAANTASNTEELGTAMQRTASIAASAGMSFEGTAAFLAQAIETTREPAENLGTAMKTIVARFTELKKNPLEISEVDGEEVSYNKVDAALQSIGVSLKDANGQFRNLDQVFLDISQRWDSLTQTQQRYIATQAAGSRQQSRFIAMMSNYKRTTELMAYANDSAGASQEQFEKTLDSFEAKVTKLQNAWHQFLMGITDNHFIKGGVDILTGLVDGVNKLINAVSGGFGPLKSFLSLATAFIGLKTGGRIINSLIGGLGGMVDPTSSFKIGFTNGMTGKGNPALASQIYTPIVAAIHQASNQNQNNQQATLKTAEQVRYEAFKDARSNLSDISKNGGKVSDVVKQLHGLNAQDQNTLQKSFAVTFNKASSNILQGYKNNFAKQSGVSSTQQAMFSGALSKADKYWANEQKAGRITTEEYFKNISDPTTIRAALQATGGDQNKVISGYFDNLNKQIETGVQNRTSNMLEHLMNNKTLTSEQKARIAEKIQGQQQQEKIRGYETKKQIGPEENLAPPTKGEQRLEAFGNFGASVTSAGLALQSFGSVLQNSANPAAVAFGTTLSSLGGMISIMGRGITGVSSGIASLAKVLPGGVAAATGLVAGIGLALVAIVGIIAGIKAYKDKIKKDAEEVTNTYKEKSKENETNINNLNSWKEELPRLSKGVDENGNNINLENSDYQHYLEIADEIAKINPEIVKGYNAQGHAIIDNNNALEETLQKQKEIQEQNLEDYTSKSAMDAVVKARDLNKVRLSGDESWRQIGKSHTKKRSEATFGLAPQEDMAQRAKEMVKIIKENNLSTEEFDKLNIDLDALERGDQKAVATLASNINSFTAHSKALMQAAGDDISEETQKSFDKAAKGFTKSSEELDEIITPVYEQLSAKMASEGVYKNIPDDMATFFNQGLKTIASDVSLSSEDMVQKSNELANTFSNLTAKGGEYDAIMSKIAEAQSKFGEDLDASAYDQAADEAVTSLEKIRDGIDSTAGYAPALTEFLDNQITQIKNFTEEGAVSVTEALNTMTDEISAAEGALESFKKVEEGSNFTTAAKGMKEIYDTITKTEEGKKNEHAEGEGDQTYWAGAESLIGRDNLKDKSKKEVDAALKTLEPMLKEGQEGYDNFKRRWLEVFKDGNKGIEGLKLDSNNLLKEIDMDANPDAYKQIAEALGMSEDFLTSMLNKGRQFGEIDFKNLDKVREGLATSDQIIAGQKEDVKGKKNIYMKEEALNAELANAGITSVKEQEDTKRQLEKEQGIKVISKAAEIGINEFKDMGIHSQESLIATLDATGQYTKEEIQDYAERYAKVNKKAEEFNKEDFDAAFAAHEAAKDPVSGEQLKSLQDIDVEVASIADMMANQRIEEGHLDGTKAKEAQKMLYGKEKGADTEAQYFAQGKNAKGELISPEEYKKTSKSLDKFVNESQTYVDKLKEGRKNTKAGSEERKKYDKEIAAFEQMIGKAKEYREKGKTGFHNAQDEKIGAINAKTGNFLAGKTWKDFKGTKNQNALQDIYEATLEPKELTKGFRQSLKALGMTATEALESGLITEKSYNKFKEKAKKDQEEKNNAEQQGADEANKEETEKKKTKGKKDQEEKNNAEDQATDEEADRQAREESERKEREQYARQAEQEKAAQQAELERQQKLQQLREQFSETVVPPGVNPQDILGEAFGQYTSEEAQQAGQNLKDNLKAIFDNLISPETLDTNSTKAAEAEAQIAQLGTSLGLSTEATKELIGKNKFLAAAEQMVGESSDKAKQGNEKLKSELEQMGNVKPDKLIKFKEELQKAASPSMPNKKEKGKEEKQETVMPPSVQKAEDHESTFTVKTEDKELDKTEEKIDETTKKANKGATYTLKVNGGKNLSKGIQKAEAKDKTIKVNYTKGTQEKAASNTATVDYKLGKQELPKPKSTQVNYTLGSQVNPSPKTVDISPNFTGVWEKKLKIIKDDARGQNNTGKVPSVPALGSAATGTSKPGTGRLGPKGKGGLTLTGELGYEVAWLPREHRSMILGVRGPEMVNLPSDAVIWNHKQSEQIVKKNAIPSGSAWVGAGSAGGDVNANMTLPGDSKNLKNNNKNNNKNKDKKDKDKDNKNKDKQNKTAAKIAKGFQKIVQKGGKLSVWWDNQTRKVDAILRKVDKNQKKWETQLNKVGNTLSSMTSYTKAYEKVLAQSIKLNQQSKKRADLELKRLSGQKGNGKRVSISYDYTRTTFSKKQRKSKEFKKANKEFKKAEAEQRKAQKALDKAEKTRSKKDDKAAKKRLKKANKRLKKADKKLRSTGTTKNTKKQKINISKYVKFDSATGTYVIDQKAISKVAKKNKSKAKAIRDKANDLIDRGIQRRNTAEDNIEKARDSLRKIGADIYEQFYGWKDELTKVFEITQKIAQTEEKRNRMEGTSDLIESMLKSGIITATSDYAALGSSLVGATARNYATNIKQESAMVDALTKEFEDIYYLSDLRAEKEKYIFTIEAYKYQEAQKQLASAKKGSKAWKEASKAAQDAVEKVAKYGYTEGDLQNSKNITREKYEEAIGARDAFNQGILGGANFGKKYFSATRNAITGMIEYDFNSSKYERDKAKDSENKASYDAAYDWIQQVIDVINSLNEHYSQLIQYSTQLVNMLRELREQYADYADELLQAYEDQKQAEVDKLEAIYNTLNDHIKDLLEQVKKNLDKRRQTEDNAKTEEDINSKQQRLARLRANTSGGNRAEIAQLEKEIADAQQSYGRTLEDQLLASLEEQADEAAKQRERQIKLLTAQLQLNHITGVNAAHINKLLSDYQSDNAEARAAAENEIKELYKANNEYSSQTDARLKILDADLQTMLYHLGNFDSEEEKINSAIESVESTLEEIKGQVAALVQKINEDFRENVEYSGTIQTDSSERQSELINEIDLSNADLEILRAKRAEKVANRNKWVDKQTDSKHKITDLTRKRDGFKKNTSDWKTWNEKLEEEKTRLATIEGHISDRDKDIKKIDEAILKAEQARSNASKELASLTKIETQEVTYKLSDVEKVMRELDLSVGDDFDSIKDLTKDQADKIANLTDEDLKQLESDTGLSFNALAAIREQTKDLSNLTPVVNVYVDKNGNVTTNTNGGNNGNGNNGNGNNDNGNNDNAAEKAAYSNQLGKAITNAADREAAGKQGLTSSALERTIAAGEAAGKSAADVVRDLANTNTLSAYDIVLAASKSDTITEKEIKSWIKNSPSLQKAYDKVFAKGGFANFTGPAWLDGTRAKPEAVLSATDTKNFVQLRDILSTVMKNIPSTENTTYGNTTYDIDINVDHIANDYDVDKVAKRIEKIIVEDANYRNVTMVRKFR